MMCFAPTFGDSRRNVLAPSSGGTGASRVIVAPWSTPLAASPCSANVLPAPVVRWLSSARVVVRLSSSGTTAARSYSPAFTTSLAPNCSATVSERMTT
jgi:hypothetical protein